MNSVTQEILVIRDKEVARKLSISRSTVWSKVKNERDFPKPFSISSGCTGWYLHEVDAYIADKAKTRNYRTN